MSGASGGDPADARLTHVEEHVGFVEHAMEQLSDEIAVVNRRLAEVTRRLEALETRLRKAAEVEQSPGREPGSEPA